MTENAPEEKPTLDFENLLKNTPKTPYVLHLKVKKTSKICSICYQRLEQCRKEEVLEKKTEP